MADFRNALILLENWGLTDVLLPFLLIFTIIFSILEKTNILGAGKKNMNVAISFVMALTVVIPHVTGAYPAGSDAVVIINSAIPQVSVLIVAVIMCMILIGLFGGGANWNGSSFAGTIALVSFAVVTYIFGRAAGWFGGLPSFLSFLDDPETQALVTILLVFGLVIWYVTKPENPQDGQKASRLLQGVGEFFGK